MLKGKYPNDPFKNWKPHIFKSLTTDSLKPPLKCGNVGAEKDKPTRLMNLQFKKKGGAKSRCVRFNKADAGVPFPS